MEPPPYESVSQILGREDSSRNELSGGTERMFWFCGSSREKLKEKFNEKYFRIRKEVNSRNSAR